MPRPEDFEDLKSRVGRTIAARRQALGLTQATLANRIGVSQQFVGNVEQGRQNLTLYTLLRFAEGLAVRVRDLFDDLEA